MNRVKMFLTDMAKDVSYKDVSEVCGNGYGSAIHYCQCFEVWLEKMGELKKVPASTEGKGKA